MTISTYGSYCSNNADLVEVFIGSSYDTVKFVADNMTEIGFLYDFLNRYRLPYCVNSTDAIKALDTKYCRYARVYLQTNGVKSVQEYFYDEYNQTGIIPTDPTATGSWLPVQLIPTKNVPSIDAVISSVDAVHKTVLFSFKSEGKTLFTDSIDLSDMFKHTQDTIYGIWFGFTPTDKPKEEDITKGTHVTNFSATNNDITLTRPVASLEYMFVWLPEPISNIKGFLFSSIFLDQWAGIEITVNGIKGKVFISDNKTNAIAVSMEVSL